MPTRNRIFLARIYVPVIFKQELTAIALMRGQRPEQLVIEAVEVQFIKELEQIRALQTPDKKRN